MRLHCWCNFAFDKGGKNTSDSIEDRPQSAIINLTLGSAYQFLTSLWFIRVYPVILREEGKFT